MQFPDLILIVISAVLGLGMSRIFMHFRKKKQARKATALQALKAQLLRDMPPEPESKNKSKRKRQQLAQQLKNKV
jgi:uncharacterized protein HemX